MISYDLPASGCDDDLNHSNVHRNCLCDRPISPTKPNKTKTRNREKKENTKKNENKSQMPVQLRISKAQKRKKRKKKHIKLRSFHTRP